MHALTHMLLIVGYALGALAQTTDTVPAVERICCPPKIWHATLTDVSQGGPYTSSIYINDMNQMRTGISTRDIHGIETSRQMVDFKKGIVYLTTILKGRGGSCVEMPIKNKNPYIDSCFGGKPQWERFHKDYTGIFGPAAGGIKYSTWSFQQQLNQTTMLMLADEGCVPLIMGVTATPSSTFPGGKRVRYVVTDFSTAALTDDQNDMLKIPKDCQRV